MIISKFDLDYVIDPQARKFCGPLFFTSSLETPVGTIPNNGSFGLIDTGERKLLVTCYHVWEAFKELRSQNPNFKFAVCLDMGNPVSMDVDSLLVDEDKRADIVTFAMEELLPVCGGLEFYNLQRSPAPRVNVGEMLFFIGFPGKGREVVNNQVGFPRQPCGVALTEVGTSFFYSDVTNLNKTADDFGGISGCPCFAVRENRPLKLVGFATGFALKRLSFTYASRIRPDGRIDSTM